MLVLKKEQKATHSVVALSIHFEAWSYPTTWEFEVSRVAFREKTWIESGVCPGLMFNSPFSGPSSGKVEIWIEEITSLIQI